MSFTHLHVHTEYSSLDGAGRVGDLVARAKELRQEHIAITDHGNMCGVYHLYKECKKHDVKPIYGIEFYHQVEGVEKRLHLVTLAKNMDGLRKLYKLHKLSYEQQVTGAFGKKYPIITYQDLIDNKEDIVVMTACPAGHLPHLIQQKETNTIYSTIELLKKHFDNDLYFELQSNSIFEQAYINKQLYNLSTLYGIECVVTNDVHYTLEEDASVHEMLLAMQTKKKMGDPKRFKFPTNDFWLKSEEEMLNTTFGIDKNVVQKCIDNTQIVANKCTFELEFPNQDEVLPRFADDENKVLRQFVNNGWREKEHNKTNVEIERTKYELDVIESKGYSGYYLIVSDYINWAKSNNIVVGGGRGSGVGSFVAYLTGMTTLNPIEYGLLFERFLNPERYTSPDFDVDFSDRDAVVRYLQEKWGYDNVSAIIAFGTLTAKAVFRSILRIHGFNETDINKISSTFPKKLELTLEDCEQSKQFQDFKKEHPDLVRAMYRLEGVVDHTTTHAAGVLITPKPIHEFCPMLYDSDMQLHVVGFDKYMLEELGLYKFDILKLKTLNVIDDTINLIKERHDINIDFKTITKDDIKIYDALCSGDVFGVFQLEAQQDMTMKIQPRDFEALTALNALIRPGTGNPEEYIARKNGKEFSYYHDLEKPYMQSTYNTITYQEQFMMRVNVLAGWSLGKGDSLRKVKHIRENTELREQYLADCKAIGLVTDEQAIQSWDEIVDALEGGYSFNKSHAASYADISYQTSWLKYYYPLEFMTALMNSKRDEKDSIAVCVSKCKELKIRVLPPDINNSGEYFTIEELGIRYALPCIDGIGDAALQNILSLQPIMNFEEFVNECDNRACNKKVIMSLIKSGTLSCFDFNKLRLMIQYLELKGDKKDLRKHNEIEYNEITELQWEKEVIGFYLTKSPLERFGFKPLAEYPDQTKAIIGGEILKCHTIVDKNKRQMAFLSVSTQYGIVEAVVFANQYEQYSDLLTTDSIANSILMIKGKRDKTKVLVNEITKIW